jgi:hypothetical protein
MTNHSKTEVYRLQWPEHANLKFSPTLAHLHPDHTKDVTVTFKSDATKVLTETAINCKVTKIKYDKPIDQVGGYNLFFNTVESVLSDTPRDQGNVSDCTGCLNLSNPTHQETREMCQIVQDVGKLRFCF